MRDVNDIPRAIRAQPLASDFLVVDARLSLHRLAKALSDGGLSIINDRTGRLVITDRAEDFKSGADWLLFSSEEVRGGK